MLLFTKLSPVHKALGRKVYAEWKNRILRQEDNPFKLSQWDVVEVDLNIWESRLSPRLQLLALLWAPPPGASAGNSSFLPSFLPQPMKNATKYGNMTQDHVMHLLLVREPSQAALTSHPIPIGPWLGLCFKTCTRPGSQQISEGTQMWPLTFYEVWSHCSPLFCV